MNHPRGMDLLNSGIPTCASTLTPPRPAPTMMKMVSLCSRCFSHVSSGKSFGGYKYSNFVMTDIWFFFSFCTVFLGQDQPNKHQQALVAEVSWDSLNKLMRLCVSKRCTVVTNGNVWRNYKQRFLFTVFAINSTVELVPYLVSNAIAVSATEASRVRELVNQLVSQETKQFGHPINLVMGPVFDYNDDSLPDDFTSFR